jgi:hypothetical protein
MFHPKSADCGARRAKGTAGMSECGPDPVFVGMCGIWPFRAGWGVRPVRGKPGGISHLYPCRSGAGMGGQGAFGVGTRPPPDLPRHFPHIHPHSGIFEPGRMCGRSLTFGVGDCSAPARHMGNMEAGKGRIPFVHGRGLTSAALCREAPVGPSKPVKPLGAY